MSSVVCDQWCGCNRISLEKLDRVCIGVLIIFEKLKVIKTLIGFDTKSVFTPLNSATSMLLVTCVLPIWMWIPKDKIVLFVF